MAAQGNDATIGALVKRLIQVRKDLDHAESQYKNGVEALKGASKSLSVPQSIEWQPDVVGHLIDIKYPSLEELNTLREKYRASRDEEKEIEQELEDLGVDMGLFYREAAEQKDEGTRFEPFRCDSFSMRLGLSPRHFVDTEAISSSFL